MLLRRITQHVQNQNWFAVFLDFLIVVVGVFIGIQVANWNEQINADKHAEVKLSNLLEDLKNEKSVINFTRDYWLTTTDYGEKTIAGFHSDPSISDKQFIISAYQTSQAIVPSSNRATFEQMLASGDINISGSEHFKASLLAFYISNWSENVHMNTQTLYRTTIRRFIPHKIQKAIRDNCGDTFVKIGFITAVSLPKHCDFDFEESDFVEAAKELRQRTDLLMELNEHMSDLNSKLQNLAQTDIQINDIYEQLSQEAQ
jgi:hypothetical protein